MKYISTYDDLIFEGFLSNPKESLQNFVNYIKDKPYSIKRSMIKLFAMSLLTTVSHTNCNQMIQKLNTTNEIKELLLSQTKNSLKSFTDFINKVGMRESSGNWEKVNRFGYMGFFQFGNEALTDVGVNIHKIGRKNFLSNKDLQIDCFKKYLRKNKTYMNNVISEWNNKEIKMAIKSD